LVLKQGSKGSWKLPACLRWFDLADLYAEFNRNPITYLSMIVPNGWFAIYWYIAFRNPINYFTYKYLSFPLHAAVVTNTTGDKEVGNSTGDHPGHYYVEVRNNVDNTITYKAYSRIYYEYYYIKPYTMPFTKTRKCIRFRMGYKIGDPQTAKDGQIQQGVFTLNPFASYSGV